MLRTFDKMHEDCGSCVYWGERGDWLVAAGQSRDSDALERSNFECIRRAVDAIDPDCWAVESESHWAVGWVEHLLIDPACAAAIAEVERILDDLEDYPVVDEDHFSETEFNDYLESWENWGEREYRREIKKHLEGRGLHRLAALVDDLDLSDALEDARQHVNWEYEGDHINIEGLVESTIGEPLLKAVRAYRAA